MDVHPDESDKNGVLEIVFITSAGNRITGEPRLTVERLVGGKVKTSREGERRMQLPYGTYRLRGQYFGAYPVEKIVSIENPLQAVSLCFTIAPIELSMGGNLVRGRISEASRRKDCRLVRFVSPFRDGSTAETMAVKSGYFFLQNVLPGEYLVFTIGDEGVCEAAEVTILPGVRRYDLEFPWAPLKIGKAERSKP